MRRGPYTETADINSMVAAQLQHYESHSRQQSAARRSGSSFYEGEDGSDPRGQHRRDSFGPHIDHSVPPHTSEGLEKKILGDISGLSQEQEEAERAEVLRHKERLNSINARHIERLSVLRARQASVRSQLIQEESWLRQQQCRVKSYPLSAVGPSVAGPSGVCGFQSGDPVATIDAFGRGRAYMASFLESIGDRQEYVPGSGDHRQEYIPGGGDHRQEYIPGGSDGAGLYDESQCRYDPQYPAGRHGGRRY